MNTYFAQEFLKSEFNSRHKKNPNFSIRAFARYLDISPAQLSQLMSGKRAMTLALFEKISKKLEVSPSKKNKIITKLINIKSKQSEELQTKIELQEDEFRLIADWYHLAILNLSKIRGAKADPSWIAQRLNIKYGEAKDAIERLERMKIIETKPKFRQLIPPFEVVSTVPSDAIRKYHKQNLNLAYEKIESVPVNLRQFQSMAVNLNKDQLSDLKEYIDEFLNNVPKLYERSDAKEVYHLNVQLFPVTKIED